MLVFYEVARENFTRLPRGHDRRAIPCKIMTVTGLFHIEFPGCLLATGEPHLSLSLSRAQELEPSAEFALPFVSLFLLEGRFSRRGEELRNFARATPYALVHMRCLKLRR